jgi:hypothetical protein
MAISGAEPMQPNQADPGKLVGAKAIAAHFGKGPRWVYKKLEFSRRPPPIYQPGGRGSELIAFVDELDQWARRRTFKPNDA